jgi:hypothetical protein
MVFSGDYTLSNLLCAMNISLNVFETKTVHFNWDYLEM